MKKTKKSAKLASPVAAPTWENRICCGFRECNLSAAAWQLE